MSGKQHCSNAFYVIRYVSASQCVFIDMISWSRTWFKWWWQWQRQKQKAYKGDKYKTLDDIYLLCNYKNICSNKQMFLIHWQPRLFNMLHTCLKLPIVCAVIFIKPTNIIYHSLWYTDVMLCQSKQVKLIKQRKMYCKHMQTPTHSPSPGGASPELLTFLINIFSCLTQIYLLFCASQYLLLIIL